MLVTCICYPSFDSSVSTYLISGFLVMTTQTREFPMMSMTANIESTATMVAWPDSEIMTYRVQSALKDNSLSRKQKQTNKQKNN